MSEDHGVASVTPYGHLLSIARDLACGIGLPECFDEDNFYKSTPQAERRRVLKAIEDVHARDKRLAIQLRQAADALNAEASTLSAQQRTGLLSMDRPFRDYGDSVVGEAASPEDWRRAFIWRDYYAGRITREEADKRIAEGKSSEQGNG